jgi:hypothetical protein
MRTGWATVTIVVLAARGLAWMWQPVEERRAMSDVLAGCQMLAGKAF